MVMKKLKNTRFLLRAGLIAAAYTALCLIFQPISFGFAGVQLRVSEALTLLPLLTSAAVPGLFVGCFLSNLLGGAMMIDVVVGSLTTLAAALCTRALKDRPVLAALPPVLFNAVIVGWILCCVYAVGMPLWLCMLSVGLGQLAACYGIGLPLMKMMKRIPEKYFEE